MRRLFAAIVAVVAAIFVVSPAQAHAVGLSTGTYVANESGVVATLAFSRAEVAGIVDGLDANGDHDVTIEEIARAKPALAARIVDRIEVKAGLARCPGTLAGATLTEADGIAIEARYACPRAERLAIALPLLEDLSHGHRHLAQAGARSEVLLKGHATLSLDPAPAAIPSPARVSIGAMFVTGVEHILTGYDHIVFLLGLLLLRTRRTSDSTKERLRELLAVVTAFTVGHSVSLAIAVLGIYSPSPAIVEPAIALSIAYVGIENFWVRDASKRWRITLPFGFVHGFGFAGALREIALPREAVPQALLGFNVGVEAGQLLLIAAALPLAAFLRRRGWFEPRGFQISSGAVVIAGLVWFVARI